MTHKYSFAWLPVAVSTMLVALFYRATGSLFGFTLDAPVTASTVTLHLALAAALIVTLVASGLRPHVRGVISPPSQEFRDRHLRPAKIVRYTGMVIGCGVVYLLVTTSPLDYRGIPLLLSLIAARATDRRCTRLLKEVTAKMDREVEWLEGYRL